MEKYTYDGNAAGNYYIFRPDGSVFIEVHGSEDDTIEITGLLNSDWSESRIIETSNVV